MPSEPEIAYDDAWARRVSAGVAAGSRDALEALYRARYVRLFRLVRSTTRRDDAFALDCVHDAWLRVVRGLPAIDTVAGLDRWLARAAMSAALDRLRAESVRDRHESASAAPEERTVWRDEEERIDSMQRELERLSTEDQRVIGLRFRGGLSLEALGSALGIGMKAAEIRLRRALGRLREGLGVEEVRRDG